MRACCCPNLIFPARRQIVLCSAVVAAVDVDAVALSLLTRAPLQTYRIFYACVFLANVRVSV